MKSSLNPEAKEFRPRLGIITKKGYEVLFNTVKISNKFPVGQSANIYKTSADFISVTFQLRKNVIQKKNMIIKSEKSDTELNMNDSEGNAEKIIHVNDSILDRTNINIDTVSKTNGPISNKEYKKNAPTKTQVKAVPPADANIPHPQITFKDKVDNSNNIWIPKISDKPNGIAPLSLRVIYNKNREAIGYEHPYSIELKWYYPPPCVFKSDEEPLEFPKSFEDTPFTYINTESQVDDLINHLDQVTEIAVDVEHHSLRSYQGITCLIQITTKGGDFIIDALAVREHLYRLNHSFTDPRKIKVLHGAGMDVLWLQRDFGVYIVGLFDTYYAAQVLGMKYFSLKNLLIHYCNVNVDKRYQLSDWRIRPLPEEMINYARSDTHYLLYIWRRMKNDILEGDENKYRCLLLSVFEQSRCVCAKTYNKQPFTEFSYLDAYSSLNKNFNKVQLIAFKTLFEGRDKEARCLDESPQYILPDRMLIKLAESLPLGLSKINACCDPLPPYVKKNAIEINKLMHTCHNMPMELQLSPTPVVSNADFQQIGYNAHDNKYSVEHRKGNFKKNKYKRNKVNKHGAAIKPFSKSSQDKPNNDVEKIALNAEVKQFVPPYERYKNYCKLSQEDKDAVAIAVKMVNKVNKDTQTDISMGTGFVKKTVRAKVTSKKIVEQPGTSKKETDISMGTGFVKKTVRAKVTSKKIVEQPGTSKKETDISMGTGFVNKTVRAKVTSKKIVEQPGTSKKETDISMGTGFVNKTVRAKVTSKKIVEQPGTSKKETDISMGTGFVNKTVRAKVTSKKIVEQPGTSKKETDISMGTGFVNKTVRAKVTSKKIVEQPGTSKKETDISMGTGFVNKTVRAKVTSKKIVEQPGTSKKETDISMGTGFVNETVRAKVTSKKIVEQPGTSKEADDVSKPSCSNSSVTLKNKPKTVPRYNYKKVNYKNYTQKSNNSQE